MRTDLNLLAFILPFISSQFWILARLVCSFHTVMAESQSIASTAVTKVAVVGRYAGYNRYNNGPRTLP